LGNLWDFFMPKKKALSELYTLVMRAREMGFPMPQTKSGGGWINVARLCGGGDLESKSQAREFLRGKFTLHKTKPAARAGGVDVASKDFLETFAWRKLRMEALKKYGPKCMCCGATPATGAVMNVDHVKPRKLFPALALDINNLQILCHECNHGKGNWDQTDWRPA